MKRLLQGRLASRPIICPALGLVLCLVAAFLSRQWSVYQYSRAAQRALATGRYEVAERPLDQWLRARPGDPEAHYHKARFAIARGNLPALEQSLRRAEALGLPASRLGYLRALFAAQLGGHQEVEPVLRAAFERSAGPDAQLDEALARLYLESYNIPQAHLVIERWLHDAPQDPKPFLWRAEIDSRVEGRSSSLLSDYREALKRDPNLAKARLGLADQLRQAHKNSEAASEYRAYLALKPSDAEGYLGAGRNALELGDDESAQHYFARVLELDPKNALVHRQCAEIDLRRGAVESALRRLDEAVRLDPYDATSRYTRALALRRLGRVEEARIEQAAEKRLKESYMRLTEMQDYLVRHPEDRDTQCAIASWMFEHAHDAEAIRWCQKILKEDPGHARANRLLAEYYERQGKHGTANYYRLNATTQVEASTPRPTP